MLIKGAALLQKGELIHDRDILIEKNQITKIGRDLKEKDEETIDAKGTMAIPGLINAHTHLAMTLFRGYADDMELMPWLKEKIWPLEAKLTPEDIIWGVKLGCMEQIHMGITCYNDMYYFMNETAQTTKEMGLRAFISGVLIDARPDLADELEPFINKWKDDDLITPTIGPHAIYSCSEETLLKTVELAKKYDTMLHIHVSETKGEVERVIKEKGMSPVEYLDSIGFLSEKVVAAHCTWLSQRDVSILAKRNVNVAHCSISNHKLSSGTAPLDQLTNAGANICLGTDGASSNNCLNMFQEMKTTSISQKCAHFRPELFKAQEVWNMATENAYKAFQLNMGLHVGTLADLSLIDLKKPWLCPLSNPVSHLVYSMSEGVDTTIVNGQVLMRDGIIPGEEKILERAQKQFEDLTSR